MAQAPYVCDLHCHTVCSDGNDTPLELILHAAQRGLKVIAMTDHDKKPLRTICIDGQEENIVAYAEGHGIHLIRGIEISCETEIDDVHIIGLGCDWDDDYFDELDSFTQISKVKSYQELVERLYRKGIQITWEELIYNGGSPLSDKNVQKKRIFEMMAQKGYAVSWNEAKLQVKTDPDLNIHRKKPNAADTISELHKLGGIAILAHPYLIDDEVSFEGMKISRQEYISKLIEVGLDGIEASYTYNKTSYNGRMTPEEIYDEVMELYSKRGLIISGGSDYHADYKKSSHRPRELGECGISLEAFQSYEKLKNL